MTNRQSSLDKQSNGAEDARDEESAADSRKLDVATGIDVNDSEEQTQRNKAQRQSIESSNFYTSLVGSDNSSGEETQVLKTIVGSALGRKDLLLSLCPVSIQWFHIASHRGVITYGLVELLAVAHRSLEAARVTVVVGFACDHGSEYVSAMGDQPHRGNLDSELASCCSGTGDRWCRTVK